MDCQKVDKQWKEWRMRLKLRELHELPSTEMVKSGTIYRLTSDCRKAMEEERCPTIRKELDKCNTRLQFLADCLHFTPSGTGGTVSREEEKTSFERMSCCFRPKQKTMNFMQKSLWNLWYDLRFFGHILLRLGCHFWNAPLRICLHHFYHNLIFKTSLLNQNDRTQCKWCHIVQYSQSYYERFCKFFLFWEKTDVLCLHEILDQIVTFYWNVNFLQVFNQFIFKPYETEYTSTR